MRFLRFFFIFVLLILSAGVAFSQAKSKKVLELERQRKKALEQVAKTEQEIKNVRANKSKKQREEQLLKKQVAQRQKALSILDLEIKALSQSIDSLALQELHLRNQEEIHKKSYERSLLALQKQKNSTDKLVFILSSKNFDQGIRRSRFITQYARANQQAAEALRSTRNQILATQRSIILHKKDKSSLLAVREKEKNKLEAQHRATGQELLTLKGQEKKLQKLRNKYQQQANALNKKIEERIAYEIAEADRKAREANKKGGKTEKRVAVNKGGYAMTAEERKLSGSFAGNKGNLLVPVNGQYTIISHFGVQQHKAASKVQTNNAGIDIKVPKGTHARAVFDGVVTKVFVLPGYNTSIIIRHGNYLTVYANLSSVNVSTGQKVKTGQTIGVVATNEGNTILHFQLWYERNKQNPELWIR